MFTVLEYDYLQFMLPVELPNRMKYIWPLFWGSDGLELATDNLPTTRHTVAGALSLGDHSGQHDLQDTSTQCIRDAAI